VLGTEVAFVLDIEVGGEPQIQEAIACGRAKISGQFSQTPVQELAAVLEGGLARSL
jgi:preprotein translocase subunit SecD